MSPEHVHYWIIDTAEGRTSWGYCQTPNCPIGAKQFTNIIMADDFNIWQEVENERKRRGK